MIKYHIFRGVGISSWMDNKVISSSSSSSFLQFHVGVARRFGFECTPDPDTGGCLEFPLTSQPLLQFVSVLYRDMGENIEGVRARAFVDPDNDPQQVQLLVLLPSVVISPSFQMDVVFFTVQFSFVELCQNFNV